MTLRLDPPPKRIEDNRLSTTLDNMSRIVSLPLKEETVRGYSNVDMIIEDEASRVPDDLYFSIRPMMAVSGGTLILMSTPFGKRGHFCDIFINEPHYTSWERVRINAEECPRISSEFLKEELESMGEWFYEQEYFCEFKDNEDSVFSFEYIKNALTDEFDIFPGGE